MRDWSDESVVVIGAARQGIALARYLLERGARVLITDQRPLAELKTAQQTLSSSKDLERLEWVCGGHPLTLLEGATMICPSGGVPLELPLIVEARRRNIPLSNDSQIFLESAPCKVIGITGSAGKTTTTTLVGRMAQAAVGLPVDTASYRKAWVGGNIGSPLISDLDKIQPEDLAVMELSSFQLEIMTRSPQIAAILNITPNHLDRHGTMAAYTNAKAHILAHQSPQDSAILGRDDPASWALASAVRGSLFSFGLSDLPENGLGAFLHHQYISLRTAERSPGEKLLVREVIDRGDILLRGEHNLLNVMAACTIAAAANLPDEAVSRGIKGFSGVPHRLEFVGSWGGADWYNDSIATAPERTMAAIRSFHEPLVLLAGGRDKDLPWEELADLIRKRVDHLIVFGEAAGRILRSLAVSPDETISVTRCNGLREAVQAAAELVRPGDVVLLSPGGTSFDEFNDFEERGECFARWVKELK
jgi:UDP-N-acetylmuramoylalanine--D-glutamate ligase